MKVRISEIEGVINLIEDLYKRELLRCVNCGERLNLDLSLHKHLGGHYWLFITCWKCSYQNALWKILRRVEVRRVPIEE